MNVLKQRYAMQQNDSPLLECFSGAHTTSNRFQHATCVTLVGVLGHQEAGSTIFGQFGIFADIEAIDPEELRSVLMGPITDQPAAKAVVFDLVIGIGSITIGVIPKRTTG